MPLDLARVALEIGEMTAELKASERKREDRLQYALSLLYSQADKIESLKKKIDASKTTWLVAGLMDGIGQHQVALPCPRSSQL